MEFGWVLQITHSTTRIQREHFQFRPVVPFHLDSFSVMDSYFRDFGACKCERGRTDKLNTFHTTGVESLARRIQSLSPALSANWALGEK